MARPTGIRRQNTHHTSTIGFKRTATECPLLLLFCFASTPPLFTLFMHGIQTTRALTFRSPCVMLIFAACFVRT